MDRLTNSMLSHKLFLFSITLAVTVIIASVTSYTEPFYEKADEVHVKTYASLQSALVDLRAIRKTIFVSQSIVIDNLTIPQNTTVHVIKGGMLTMLPNGRLTINGKFIAGKYQVFSDKGVVVFGRESVKEIYPQWWGAVADGTSDCYAALKAMAASVNASGGIKVVFPAGTYFIAQYKNNNGRQRNNISDIIFENCSGLHITGYGAKIDVFGKFHRSADYIRLTRRLRLYRYSNSNSVVPFLIRNCSNFTIEGFELNGNVDKMTRDKGVVESSGHGIIIQGGDNFVLKNLYIHHFHSDGIYLTGRWVDEVIYPCRNGSLINIKSTNNARQGLSIIQARDITCTDCIFADTGKTGGVYGGHAPQAGVDIEPNYSVSSPDMRASENTGNITFIRCTFENNNGAQFNAAHAQSSDAVLLRDCLIEAKSSNYRYSVIFAVNGGIMENCTIDTGNGSFYAGWGKKFWKMQKIAIKGSSIKTRMHGIVSQNDAEVLIENNRIINYYDKPDTHRFISDINNSNFIFRNNYVFIPKEVFNSDKNFQIASYLNVRESSNNIFDTDLMASPTNNHFATKYGKTTTIVNDRYAPQGSLTAYRPFPNAVWDNSRPYSNTPLQDY